MIKDILFVIMVLSITSYAHTYKNKIIGFIEVCEEEEEEYLTRDETLLTQR